MVLHDQSNQRTVPTSKPAVLATQSPGPGIEASAALDRAAKVFQDMHAALKSQIPRAKGGPPPPAPQPPGVVYSGRGFWVGKGKPLVAISANQSVQPHLVFARGSTSYLYAPTMLGAFNDCIEVVTAYSAGPPAVWTWDWCRDVKNPAGGRVVSHDFVAQYVRDFGTGIGEYTVQTRLMSDGKTWVARLYNYQKAQWDDLYSSSGKGKTGMDPYGWDFFEEHGSLADANQADYCKILPPVFESTDVQISFDNKTFSRLDRGNGQTLNFANLGCAKLQFSVADEFSHWIVNAP
jgi:hypothetical protein